MGDGLGVVKRGDFGGRSAQESFFERLPALAEVEVSDLLDGHAPAEAGGDDGAGRGAGEEIEVIAEDEGPGFFRVFFCVVLAQQFLDFDENFEREDAANAAAIQRENSFHGVISYS